MKSSKRSAFTLVELVVVIAVAEIRSFAERMISMNKDGAKGRALRRLATKRRRRRLCSTR